MTTSNQGCSPRNYSYFFSSTPLGTFSFFHPEKKTRGLHTGINVKNFETQFSISIDIKTKSTINPMLLCLLSKKKIQVYNTSKIQRRWVNSLYTSPAKLRLPPTTPVRCPSTTYTIVPSYPCSSKKNLTFLGFVKGGGIRDMISQIGFSHYSCKIYLHIKSSFFDFISSRVCFSCLWYLLVYENRNLAMTKTHPQMKKVVP